MNSTIVFILMIICSAFCEGHNLTEKCQRGWNHYRENLGRASWANRMFDSMGKLGSGTLDGHRFFEGDYPECKRIKENETDPEAIQGLFCIGLWTNGPIPSNYRKGIGYCIPHTCTDDDAAVLLYETNVNLVRPEENTTLVYCLRDPDLSEDAGAIVSITIISVFVFIVIAATLFDVFYARGKYKTKPTKESEHLDIKTTLLKPETNGHINEAYYKGENNGNIEKAETEVHLKKFTQHEKDSNAVQQDDTNSYDLSLKEDIVNTIKQPGKLARLLLSFSLHTNIPRLLSAKHSPGSIQCLHGIRFISMAGVVWGHCYVLALGYVAPIVINPFPAVDQLYTFLSEIFQQMWLIVDTFLLLSGFLACYLFMKTINKQKNKISLRMMVMYYFHRYWRLTPIYMICIMIWVNLFKYMANGPLMPPEIYDLEGCKDIWWRNLLYIQNLWPSDNWTECFSHAWYLSIDMQLYIMAPPFIILAYFYPVFGIPLMLAGWGGSVISLIVLHHQYYSNIKEIDTYVDIYVKPWTRASPYFIGMLLAVLVYRTKGKVKIPKIFVALGWILSVSLILISMYLPYVDRAGCRIVYYACKPATQAGVVTWKSLISTMYVLGVSWIIFACVSGYGGFVNSFLSWRAWIPLSRLSYTSYLIHITVLTVYYFGSPVQLYFSHYIWLYQFCGNMIITLAVAFILSLVFEVPMMGIEKVLLLQN